MVKANPEVITFTFTGTERTDAPDFPILGLAAHSEDWIIATWISNKRARELGGLEAVKGLIQLVLRDPIDAWDTDKDMARRRTLLVGRRRMVAAPQGPATLYGMWKGVFPTGVHEQQVAWAYAEIPDSPGYVPETGEPILDSPTMREVAERWAQSEDYFEYSDTRP